MRIGLFGAGRIGAIHAGNIKAHPRAILAAIADPDAGAASRLAAEAGGNVTTIDDILGDRSIDAVFVCTPTDTHADLVERSVRAGKAVFCEKPVDLSAARIKTCLEIVAKAGGKLMVGFNRRFDPSFAELRQRITRGGIGKVELVLITSRDPSPPPLDYIARSGGLFRDMMIHDFDMARFLLVEEPVELHAVGSCLVDPRIDEAGDVDTAAVLLKTASGKIAQISNSRRATYGYDQRIEVHGSEGMLGAGNRYSTTVEHANAQGYRHDPALPFFLERYAEAYRAELDAFVDAMLGSSVFSPSGEDGLRAQILADAATQSAKTGRPARIKQSG
jgi:myo-inositol 2-dehydrogenase / D-chiro-inositol 1-dehydrogenase